MQPITEMRDVEQLQQIALLYETENGRLHRRLEAVMRELAEVKGGSGQKMLALELAKLQRQNEALRKKVFGESSERRSKGDGSEPDASSNPTKPGTDDEKKPHPGRTAQPDLPIEVVEHDLSEDERDCPSCGGELREWAGQYEESEEITVVERAFKLVVHRRKKHNCACYGAVVVAPGPLKLAPGCRYSIDFAVESVVGKFGDQLPWDRQRKIMEREGLVVSTQVLWDVNRLLAGHCRATYDAIGRELLASPVVLADETWWRHMGDRSRSKWWAWHLANPEYVYVWMHPERSTRAAAQMLEGYDGVLVADGYGAYTALQKASPTFRIAHCWVHARRKWVEAQPFFPDECDPVLDLIGQLYRVEKDLRRAEAGHDEIQRGRQERSKPIVEEIKKTAAATPSPRGSSLRTAIEYMFGVWNGLQVFLEDPAVPLDTNLVERAIRAPALGRKNYYGCRSERGLEVAAIFHSLVQTARLNKIEPRRYLREVARRAIECPNMVTLPRDL